jgi:hypothetical protein
MIKVSHLTKDERIKEILLDINKKAQNPIIMVQSFIKKSTLNKIIESIEDRIYFISESPSFDFNGRNWTCQQDKCDTIEDFKSLMDNHPNEFFVLYNIMLTNGIISNAPGISQNQSYMIRGVFIEDPSIKREQIINQILNEE